VNPTREKCFKDIISRKLRRYGYKFKFVKFYEVENASTLDELDDIWIKNMKMYVKKSRYQRNEMSETGMRAKVVHVRKEIIKIAIWRKKEQRESYAQVVKGGEIRRA